LNKRDFMVIKTILIFFSIWMAGDIQIAYGQSSKNNIGKFRQGGTLIIAAISKDGISMLADSRNSFEVPGESNQTSFSYWDGNKKIFQIQKTIFSVAGMYSFDGLTLTGLVKEFIKFNKNEITVNNLFLEFTKFAKYRLSPSDYQFLLDDEILVAGYNNNIPQIYSYKKGKTLQFSTIGLKMNQLNSVSKDPELVTQLAINGFNVVNPLLEQIIKKSTSPSVGGKVTIVTMNPKSINWLQKGYSLEFNTQTDFAKAYLTKKVKIHFISKQDSLAIVEDLLRFSRRK
jgi:hypothetical protein